LGYSASTDISITPSAEVAAGYGRSVGGNSLFLGKFFPDTPLEIPCFVAQGIRLKAIEFTR
jgi:hypothetical protein